MEDLPQEKKIYSEIQKKLFYIIPEKWESIYLYASSFSVAPKRTTGEMYFYYFPKGIIKKKAVNCYEIPNAFNIDEDVYSRLITELYNLIKLLKPIWFRKTNKRWTSVTISIENYQFKIEYDYQNLNKLPFDSYARHVIWRYLYLKADLRLFDKKDKQIIEQYNDYINVTQLPRKDTYMEGIYKQPVKNIVDFEKTLSVDEAIARSELEDERQEKKKEKTKHHLFKKKRIINDIIEMDDEDDLGNNQILNWRNK